MEEAWQGSLNAKLSVNQMVGLWAKDAMESFSVKSSRAAEDGQGHYCTQTFEYSGGYITDWVFRTRLLSNASMRPIHDQIMQTEATRLAQLLYAVKALGVPEKAITSVKTDCLVFGDIAKKHEKRLEEAAAVAFKDLADLRGKFEGKGQAFLDSFGRAGVNP